MSSRAVAEAFGKRHDNVMRVRTQRNDEDHVEIIAEVKELPCSKGGTMKFLLVSGTGIAVMCGKVGGAKVEEGNAHRIATLWNIAERLGLSTEDIETVTDSASLHNLSLEVMARERGELK